MASTSTASPRRREKPITERSRTYGRNIRYGRNAVGLDTQQKFADALNVAGAGNVAQSTVARWERGEIVPRDDMKLLIASVLHQEVRQLFPLIPSGNGKAA